MKKILISLFILGLCGLPVVFCGGGGSTPGGDTGNPFIGTWDADTYDYTLIFTNDLYT